MAEYWAWFRGILVTANRDGSIPINSRIVLEPTAETYIRMTEHQKQLIANAPQILRAIEFVLSDQSSILDEDTRFVLVTAISTIPPKGE